MKKLLIALALLVSTSAYAVTWILVHQEYGGDAWVCTYRLMGTNYETIIVSNSFCQTFIYQ